MIVESMDTNEVIRRARVLSSPTRIAIWNSLGDTGRHPTDVAHEFALAPSTVTYHLQALVRAKLVRVYGHGRSRVYVPSGTKLGIVTEAELQVLIKNGHKVE